MTDGLKVVHREAIIAKIAANDRVERAVLFGSRATGTNTVSSDVDIALFGSGLTLTDQARLAAALDEIPMAQSVDLLLYDSISNRTLREHIRCQGVEWYARSNNTRAASPARHQRPRHGVSPSTDKEWEDVALGNLVEIFDGPHATPTKTPTGPLFLGISNLASGRLDLTATEHLSEDDYLRWTRRVTPTTNDVVFSYETRIGEAALIPNGLRACLGRRMGLLRAKDGAVDLRFLLYAFLGTQFQETLRVRTVHGSTVDRIPLIEMPSFPIHVPRDITEQCAIAHVLGTLDDKIELNRRMNATLEAMARALFRSWFVDFDPVRAKMEGRDTGLPKDIADLFPARLVSSQLGEIPEEWQIRPLDSVAHFQNGLALQKFRPSQSEARLPVVKIAQLRTGEADSGEWARATNKREFIIDNGDVVFSWSGSLLVQMWHGGRAALNQHLFKVTSKRYPKWFYLHSILSHFPEFQRIARDKATTMGHIRRHHLTDALCAVPPDRFVNGISRIFERLLERQGVNEVERRTLATLRDALLPRLVSGEMRVRRRGKGRGRDGRNDQLLTSRDHGEATGSGETVVDAT